MHYRRTLVRDGSLELDAPVYMTFDAVEDHAFALVRPWSRQYIVQSGLEDLSIEAEIQGQNPKDEQHLWTGVVWIMQRIAGLEE